MKYTVSIPFGLYVAIGIVASPVAFLLGLFLRISAGLPMGNTLSVAPFASVAYMFAWLLFIATIHKGRDVSPYVPYSILVLCGAIVLLFLIH